MQGGSGRRRNESMDVGIQREGNGIKEKIERRKGMIMEKKGGMNMIKKKRK
jgi:hypothetical protein